MQWQQQYWSSTRHLWQKHYFSETPPSAKSSRELLLNTTGSGRQQKELMKFHGQLQKEVLQCPTLCIQTSGSPIPLEGYHNAHHQNIL